MIRFAEPKSVQRVTIQPRHEKTTYKGMARGAVVDADAVVDALASGHLSGAGIDVLRHEPPTADSYVLQAWRNAEHPAHDRLILNPHTAYYCDEGEEEFRVKGSQEVRRALLGEALRNCVNGL